MERPEIGVAGHHVKNRNLRRPAWPSSPVRHGHPGASTDFPSYRRQAQRAADGFNIFESVPHQLDPFVETVVPSLQARGIFMKDDEGETSRAHLGLAVPENRDTAARRQNVAAA
jgi:hypothetical protein